MSRLTQIEPADAASVRTTNLTVTLRYVRDHAPCSRADIAAETGLNKATVSRLVTDLIERRLIREIGLTENRIGRPATNLEIDGDPYVALGVEVNGDYLAVVARNLAGTELFSWHQSFAGVGVPVDEAITAVASLTEQAIQRVASEGRLALGATVGVPGLVDADGTVRIAPNLGWTDVDLANRLAAALGHPPYPITVDNDANLAATAEFHHGSHAGTRDLIYLTGEVGIGAGVVADGRLLRGNLGFAGEIGHVQLDPDGPLCECGRRGDLEALAGTAAILRQVSPEFESRTRGDWRPEIEALAERALHDDAVTQALAGIGMWLGRGAAVLANVVNPEVVILGGYFVPLAQWLVPPAQAALIADTLAENAGGTSIVASSLGLRASAIGGAARIAESVFSGDLPTPAIS